MAKIITIANQKGGVGKTTTALCLGAELQEKGYKVLYVDLDKQCNASKTLKADINKLGTYEILADKVDAIKTIQVTANNDYVISGSKNLDTIETILSSAENSLGKEYRLKESLKSVSNEFDFVIIDTPPRIDNKTVNALTTTDYLIIVSGADMYSLDGVNDFYGVVNNIKKYTNPNLEIGGILLTKYNPRTKISQAFKDFLNDTANKYDTKVYKTFIRNNTAITETQAVKMHITEYAKNSNAHKDYLAFTDEVLCDLNN